MNKTLQGQRGFPGSLKRIKLWGLCTSQCVNNKPAVYALKKHNSWCFPYLERASQSLLRRFKYFKCKVRYKGCYDPPLLAFVFQGLRSKALCWFHAFQTDLKCREGRKKQQLFPANTSYKLSGTLLGFLSLSLPLSLFPSLMFGFGNTQLPRHVQNPFVYFQIYLRK